MPPVAAAFETSADAMEKIRGCNHRFACDVPAGGTARSRSTSAGSTSPRSSEEEGSFSLYGESSGMPACVYPAPVDLKAASELPEYDYPVPLLVKNTFIDTDVWRPASLCDFFQQRQVQSCPTSAIGAPPGLEDEVEDAVAASMPLYQSVNEQRERLTEMVGQDMSMAVGALAAPCAAGAIEVQQLTPLPPPPSQAPVLSLMPESPETPPPAQAPILRLSESLPVPQLGSAALPTVGSASHQLGGCQPCAFLYTKGCGNGVLCPFCHLCDVGERKRRARVKRAAARNLASQWTC